MSVELTGEQTALRSTVRRFFDQEAPLGKVRELADDPRGYDDKYWRQLAEFGFTAMLVPEAQGGGSLTDAPLEDMSLLAEEVGRAVAGGPFVGTNVVADALARSPGDFGDVLQALAAGDATAAWAVAERSVWDPVKLTTELVEVDGRRVLRGRKDWVESAQSVDYFLVTARDGDGVAEVLVPSDTPGVRIDRLKSLDLVRRFASVSFDDVTLPDRAVVCSGEQAWAEVERQLQVAITLLCAETVGAVDRVFDMVLEYAHTRVAFGRTIGSYQALKHRLADHKLWLEASFGLAAGLASAVSHGDPKAAELASIAKAHICDRSVETLQDCVQIFGGIGLTWEHDIHLFLRRAVTNFSLYGTPADHRERLCVLAGL